MHNTSEAYQTAIRAPVRSCTVTGTLGTLALSDSNIQSGTLYIDNQAVSDDNDVGLGACVIGEMGFDLKDNTHIADYYFGKVCKLLELPENPCMRFISDKNAVIENIARNAMKMRYRPMEAELFGDPSIDLGDTIRHTGYICGDGETMVVTHCRWQYRNTQTLQAVADMSAGIYVPEIEETTGADYVYTIIEDGTAVRLDYYIGSATHLAAPKTVKSKPVLEIGATCYTGKQVSRIVIPDGIKIVR